MAASNYNKSLDRVLVYEGGYVNHVSDPGGPTNKGIVQRVYDGYRRRKGSELRSVRDITMAEVRAIYRQQYWNVVKGNELPAGVDFVVFDGAVNSGCGQSVIWLQRALQADGVYHGPIDGDCGVGTMSAVMQHPDHDRLIAGILARRLGMLQNLKTWPVFGAGWEMRVVNVRAIGQAWASGSIGPQPVKVADLGGNAKGYAGDVAMALFAPEEGAKTAIVGGSLSGLVQSAQTGIGNYATLHRYVAYAFVALTVLGVIVGVGGAVASWWSARQNKRAQRAIEGDIVAILPAMSTLAVIPISSSHAYGKPATHKYEGRPAC